ncbi:unnamed protein product [Camellia sinensis]
MIGTNNSMYDSTSLQEVTEEKRGEGRREFPTPKHIQVFSLQSSVLQLSLFPDHVIVGLRG